MLKLFPATRWSGTITRWSNPTGSSCHRARRPDLWYPLLSFFRKKFKWSYSTPPPPPLGITRSFHQHKKSMENQHARPKFFCHGSLIGDTFHTCSISHFSILVLSYMIPIIVRHLKCMSVYKFCMYAWSMCSKNLKGRGRHLKGLIWNF
jgi:hypothetical protein